MILYSLGIMLLELDLWITSSEIYPSFREANENQFEKKYLQKISIAAAFRDKLLEWIWTNSWKENGRLDDDDDVFIKLSGLPNRVCYAATEWWLDGWPKGR